MYKKVHPLSLSFQENVLKINLCERCIETVVSYQFVFSNVFTQYAAECIKFLFANTFDVFRSHVVSANTLIPAFSEL